jgi:hypothetical protein
MDKAKCQDTSTNGEGAPPVVERLRDFLRLNYPSLLARLRDEWDLRDETVYSWLKGKSRPAETERIIAFLEALPGRKVRLTPTGYQYREYKNWRGIPKPRRCPFCKRSKGEIRKVRGGFQGVCPNCGAMGPKRERAMMRLYAFGMDDGKARMRWLLISSGSLRTILLAQMLQML